MHFQPNLSSFLLVCALVLSHTILQGNDAYAEDAALVPPKSFVSQHAGVFNGQPVRYTAIAEEIDLTDAAGEVAARFFSVSYVKHRPETANVEGANERPVSFIFNGGPGSSVVWLHMGQFGPQAVVVPSDAGDDGAAPFRCQENPDSLLDKSDLVFIDPIGTGFSTVVGNGKHSDYWGHNEDARSVAKFIRLWLNKHNRWMSPKFLIGESFGTARAALVADVSSWGELDIAFNGIILISQALDYGASATKPGNILGFVNQLPTMALTAKYHGKAGHDQTFEAFLDEVKAFAVEEYMPALYRGNTLASGERALVRQKLARFTGLSEEYIERADLMVSPPRFAKELLRADGVAVGTLDSRYKADDIDDIAAVSTEDPSAHGNGSAYTAALNHYFINELGITMNRAYKTLNMEPYLRWNWRTTGPNDYYEPSYSNVTNQLKQALWRNDDLRVLVASGYYDLVTPFMAAEYVFSAYNFPKDRVQMTYYDAGHMMYMHHPSRTKLADDVRTFIDRK